MDYRALILLLALPCFGQWGVNFFRPDEYYGDLSSSVHRRAAQWRSFETFTVSKLAYRVQSVTTGGTVRFSLRYSGANGLPSDTELAYFERNITAVGHYTDTFSQSVQISAGTPFWIVAEGVPNGSVTISFYWQGVGTYGNTSYLSKTIRAHYAAATHNGTSWSAATTSQPLPGFIPLDSSDNPPAIELATVATVATNVNSSSTPNEGGLACTFSRPLALVGIGRLRGVGGTEDSEYRIYRNGSLIATFDSVQLPNVGWGMPHYQGVGQLILQPGVEYIISFRPRSTTSQNVYIYTRRWNGIGDYFRSLWWLKDACTNVSRKDNGAWDRGSAGQFWDVRPLFQEVGTSWH